MNFFAGVYLERMFLLFGLLSAGKGICCTLFFFFFLVFSFFNFVKALVCQTVFLNSVRLCFLIVYGLVEYNQSIY